MSLKLVASNGEEHGLINAVGNSVADNDFKYMDPETKTKAQKMRKEDGKLVKARYLNSRGEHERLTKPYCKYAGDPIQTWHFIPGQVYDLPKGLVEEVNGSPGLAKRSELLDVNGRPTIKDGHAEKLHQFVPVSF